MPQLTIPMEVTLELSDGAADTNGYAQVAVVDAPVLQTYTYAIPQLLGDRVLPGMRVSVPLGSRCVAGLVVAIDARASREVPPTGLRSLIDCLDPEPVVLPQVLTLCRWVADFYMAGWGETLRLALPTEPRSGDGTRIRLTPKASELGRFNLSFEERSLINAVRECQRAWVPITRLRSPDVPAAVHTLAYGLVERGLLEVSGGWQGPVAGRWQRCVDLADVMPKEAMEATRSAPAQRRVLEFLLNVPRGATPLPESMLAQRARCGVSVFPALERKGLVVRSQGRVSDSHPAILEALPEGTGTFRLTPHQATAVEHIQAAQRGSSATPVLIHGVTGSGKTEVYLRAAQEALRQGRTALLLVPEIGLTPQLEQRAREVFSSGVAVLHSGMSIGDRMDVWWSCRRGDARVVIGPRSAAFAPLSDIGLIVIDEEQDGAFKQQERPRYQGREVALERARLEDATVVLGSATPSVEVYHRARNGPYELLELPERVASRGLPSVRVVDMRAEWRCTGRTFISVALEDAVSARLERGEQTLVLLNRRGFASSLLCRMCGERIECADCAVSLTLHRAAASLRCHYCDRQQPVPAVCPGCGAPSLEDIGVGTEQLQGSLARLFPAASIGRFDADQTRRRGAHARILSAFARGEYELLVGTQMLAKGHHFPAVTLVGVVGADAALGLPDFRAAERTFQLLTQMAGRAGRGERPGEVIVQTHQPGHYAVGAAVRQDYHTFYEEEIRYRKLLGYPPFRVLAVCVCRAIEPAAAREDADRLAAALRLNCSEGVEVLGPASSPIAKLRGKHRIQILLKANSRGQLLGTLNKALAVVARRPRDLVVDIEPMSLM